MAIYHFAFSVGSKECLRLGRKRDIEGREYEGPVIRWKEKRFFLPKDLYEKLTARFGAAHGDVVFLDENELFSDAYLDGDESPIIVGGDADGSPPMKEYLPELDDPAVMAFLVGREDLQLSEYD